MVGRKFITWVMLTLAVTSGWTSLLAADASPPTALLAAGAPVGCFNRLLKFANSNIKIKGVPRWVERLLAIGAIGFVGGTLSTNLSYHHDVYAWVTGADHVGYGIYLDMDKVMETFDDEEKKILSDPEHNAEATVKLISHRLEGDEDLTRHPADEELKEGENRHWYGSDYISGIDASHFFIHDGRLRGVCKHKAAVLAAVLNKLGVRAQVLTFQVPRSKGYAGPSLSHVVVAVPDLNLIADPMNRVIKNRQDYEAIFMTAPDQPARTHR